MVQLKEYIDDTEDFINIQLVSIELFIETRNLGWEMSEFFYEKFSLIF